MSNTSKMNKYVFSPRIDCGRRSRRPLGVKIRKMPNGLDDPAGYFPDSEEECSSVEFNASENAGVDLIQEETITQESVMSSKGDHRYEWNEESGTDAMIQDHTAGPSEDLAVTKEQQDELMRKERRSNVGNDILTQESRMSPVREEGRNDELQVTIETDTVTQEGTVSPIIGEQVRQEQKSERESEIPVVSDNVPKRATSSRKGDTRLSTIGIDTSQRGSRRENQSPVLTDSVIQGDVTSPGRGVAARKDRHSITGNATIDQEMPTSNTRLGRTIHARNESQSLIGNATMDQGTPASNTRGRKGEGARNERQILIGNATMDQGAPASNTRGKSASRERQNRGRTRKMNQVTPESHTKGERVKTILHSTVGTDTVLDKIAYGNDSIQPQQQTHYIIIERRKESRRKAGRKRRPKNRIKAVRDFNFRESTEASTGTTTHEESSDEDVLTENKRMIRPNVRKRAGRLNLKSRKRAASSNQNEKGVKKTKRHIESECDQGDIDREEIQTGVRSRKAKAMIKRDEDQVNASLKSLKNEQLMDDEEDCNESYSATRFDRFRNDKSVNKVKSMIGNDGFNISRCVESVAEDEGCSNSPLPIDHMVRTQSKKEEKKSIVKRRKRSKLLYCPKRKSKNSVNDKVMNVQKDLERDDGKASKNKEKTTNSAIKRKQHNHFDSDIGDVLEPLETPSLDTPNSKSRSTAIPTSAKSHSRNPHPSKHHSVRKQTPKGKPATCTPKRKSSSFLTDRVSVLNTSWVGPSPVRLSYLPKSESSQRNESSHTPLRVSEMTSHSRNRSLNLPLAAERNESPDIPLHNPEMRIQSSKRLSYLVEPPAAERNDFSDIRLQGSEKRKRMRSSSYQIDGINTLPGRSDSDSPNFAVSNGEEFEDAVELNGPNEAGVSKTEVDEAEVDEESAPKAKDRKTKRTRVAMPRKKATNKAKLKICGLEVSAARHQRILEEIDDPQAIRRGKRTRIAPVRHWYTKERVRYERRESGPVIKEVPKREDSPIPKRKPQTTKRKKIKQTQESSTSEHEKTYRKINPSKTIVGDNGELVKMNVMFTPAMLNLVAPGKMPDGREITDILLHKFCCQRMFSAGIFVLLPLADKGLQFVMEDTLFFYILRGEVDVTIGNTIDTIGKGCSFFVPTGNVYNIVNPKTQTEAEVLFLQIKG